MPRRRSGVPKRKPNPELAAKIRAKREGMAFARMGDRAKLRASAPSEETSQKHSEAIEAISKMAPGLVSSSRMRKRLQVVLSMVDKHGLQETLKILNINDSTLKGTLSSIFGTSGDNPLGDSVAPTVDEAKLEEAARLFRKPEPTVEEVTEKPKRRPIQAFKEPRVVDLEGVGDKGNSSQDGTGAPGPKPEPAETREPAGKDVPEPMGAHDDAGHGSAKEPKEDGTVKQAATTRPKIRPFHP